jgi:hypothetical protein
MSSVSNKSCIENQNTHLMFSKFFFRKSCRLGDNVEKYGGAIEAADDNTAHARCMQDKQVYTRASTGPLPRAPTHSYARVHTQKYAFPRQQWLRERASMLRYTHIAFLVIYVIVVIFSAKRNGEYSTGLL